MVSMCGRVGGREALGGVWTCKGVDGDASQSRGCQAGGGRHKGGLLGQGAQDVLQQQ